MQKSEYSAAPALTASIAGQGSNPWPALPQRSGANVVAPLPLAAAAEEKSQGMDMSQVTEEHIRSLLGSAVETPAQRKARLLAELAAAEADETHLADKARDSVCQHEAAYNALYKQFQSKQPLLSKLEDEMEALEIKIKDTEATLAAAFKETETRLALTVAHNEEAYRATLEAISEFGFPENASAEELQHMKALNTAVKTKKAQLAELRTANTAELAKLKETQSQTLQKQHEQLEQLEAKHVAMEEEAVELKQRVKKAKFELDGAKAALLKITPVQSLAPNVEAPNVEAPKMEAPKPAVAVPLPAYRHDSPPFLTAAQDKEARRLAAVEANRMKQLKEAAERRAANEVTAKAAAAPKAPMQAVAPKPPMQQAAPKQLVLVPLALRSKPSDKQAGIFGSKDYRGHLLVYNYTKDDLAHQEELHTCVCEMKGTCRRCIVISRAASVPSMSPQLRAKYNPVLRALCLELRGSFNDKGTTDQYEHVHRGIEASTHKGLKFQMGKEHPVYKSAISLDGETFWDVSTMVQDCDFNAQLLKVFHEVPALRVVFPRVFFVAKDEKEFFTCAVLYDHGKVDAGAIAPPAAAAAAAAFVPHPGRFAAIAVEEERPQQVMRAAAPPQMERIQRFQPARGQNYNNTTAQQIARLQRENAELKKQHGK